MGKIDSHAHIMCKRCKRIQKRTIKKVIYELLNTLELTEENMQLIKIVSRDT
jgi:hypothetical protein